MWKLEIVDMHACGEPSRMIIGGLPELKGNTMKEKETYMRNNYDFIRTNLMLEPKGHKDMFGAVLTTPIHPEADFGALFMFGSNFEDMCGHATICLCTWAINKEKVEVLEPYTFIKVDTPAGLVTAKVEVKNGKAQAVSFENVPAFIYQTNVIVPTDSHGDIEVDVVYSGNGFALIDVNGKIDILPENASKLISLGMDVKHNISKVCEFIHPEAGKLPVATIGLYSGKTNCTIFGDGQADRSPCGTGTSARVVHLHSQGKLAINETSIHKGIVGTEMKGKIIKETKVGHLTGFITEVSGTATLLSESITYIDEEDPLFKGFVIS